MTGTCVIGAGIIGSWAALHLSEAGEDTVLLEQFPLPHTRGSSHGASRAFRYLGDETMDRLDYSMGRWQSLEADHDVELFRKTGLLNFGPKDDPWLKQFMSVVRAAGKRCDWLESAAIHERFPLLNYPQEWGAAWDPDGGILFAHRCLSAVQKAFLATGGHIVNARALRMDHSANAVRVELESSNGESEWREFSRIIVACGPWTTRLIPELEPLLKTLAIPVTYWRQRLPGHSAADGFPILYNARLKGIYGLPACEYPDLVKILYHGGPEADPDARDVPGREEYVARVSEYVRQHLPGLDGRQPAIQEVCMYTMTPDSEPVIDRLGDRVVIGCGFSGSGFKHSPASGQMLAKLALGQADSLGPGYQLPKYRLDRLEKYRVNDR